MAGEIYIARQDTLENVQSTVNEIDANVDTANSTLGNFAGGGTDSVVTELNALKQAVAALTTKTDSLQTDVTNIKTDVGTIETTVEQIAGQSGGSEPWENVTDVFVDYARLGTGGFVAGKDIYILCVPTQFDIGSNDPQETAFYYYAQYGNCEVNGIAIDATDKYHYPLPMGVKFKFKTNNNNDSNELIIRNAIAFIYSK